MISAFGIDHGEVSKGLPSALRNKDAVSAYARDRQYANRMGKLMRSNFKSRNPITDIGPRMHFAREAKSRTKPRP
jgi:hypothetical protein